MRRSRLSGFASARKARVSSGVGRTPMASRNARRMNSWSSQRFEGGMFNSMSFSFTRSSMKLRGLKSSKACVSTGWS